MKKILVITTLILGMFVFTSIPANTVSASGGVECREIPGQYGSNGQYGGTSRVCDTSLIQNASFDLGTVAMMSTFALGGTALYINGKYLKSRLV